jgi:hypothetical protein
MSDSELTRRVRRLLERLAESEQSSKDERERVANEVAAEARTLPRDGVLGAIDRAVAKSIKRRKLSVYILSEVADTPDTIARVGEWLRSPDPEWRAWLIQTVEQRGLRQYGSALAEIIQHDPDPFCRDLAIHAAGTLRAPECLPPLLALANTDPTADQALAWAFKDFATEECRPYLGRYYHSDRKALRVIAAWGLAKLHDEEALKYLITMLDDPDERGVNYFKPGVSIRAAQAVSDLLGWPFEWNRSYVAKTKERLAERAGGLTRS